MASQLRQASKIRWTNNGKFGTPILTLSSLNPDAGQMWEQEHRDACASLHSLDAAQPRAPTPLVLNVKEIPTPIKPAAYVWNQNLVDTWGTTVIPVSSQDFKTWNLSTSDKDINPRRLPCLTSMSSPTWCRIHQAQFKNDSEHCMDNQRKLCLNTNIPSIELSSKDRLRLSTATSPDGEAILQYQLNAGLGETRKTPQWTQTLRVTYQSHTVALTPKMITQYLTQQRKGIALMYCSRCCHILGDSCTSHKAGALLRCGQCGLAARRQSTRFYSPLAPLPVISSTSQSLVIGECKNPAVSGLKSWSDTPKVLPDEHLCVMTFTKLWEDTLTASDTPLPYPDFEWHKSSPHGDETEEVPIALHTGRSLNTPEGSVKCSMYINVKSLKAGGALYSTGKPKI